MSTFEVTVGPLVGVEPHPNADRLGLAVFGDYRVVVAKGSFNTGDLVAYLPEASIIPVWLQHELGVVGKLYGSKKNRVKAVSLRGVVSQGLVYKARDYWQEGDDVAEELGVTKWEPPVPERLAGEVFNAGADRTIRYDIENYRKAPQHMPIGANVVMTEKVHGTFACFGVLTDRLQTVESGHLCVSSKGLGNNGLALKDNERNAQNLYLRTAKNLNILERVRGYFDVEAVGPVFVLGEIFGGNIQDLTYASKEPTFRVFDIHLGSQGTRNSGRWLNDHEIDEACEAMGLTRVPVLYRGPFDKDVLKQYTYGKETVSGRASHIREGVVIRPRFEVKCNKLPNNRLQLKSVSDDYLMRKNATEFT